MYTRLRKEIETLCKELAFSPQQFQPLGLTQWQAVEENIYKTFCQLTHHTAKPVWLWEHFKQDTFAVSFNKNPYTYLNQLIDANETVWFFVNETVNESTKFWFYHGQVKPIQELIGESCYINELYLVSKKYHWLICINHHDVLICTGQTMPGKLKALKNTLQ